MWCDKKRVDEGRRNGEKIYHPRIRIYVVCSLGAQNFPIFFLVVFSSCVRRDVQAESPIRSGVTGFAHLHKEKARPKVNIPGILCRPGTLRVRELAGP